MDLLHIDDLGAERSSEWVLEQLYSIVNVRYEENRALVVTTNLTTSSCASRSPAHGLAAGGDLRRPAPVYGEDRRMDLRAA